MRNGHFFLKSGLKVKSKKKNKKKIAYFFQKSFAKRKQDGHISKIM
jgi:hypothetical protein